jgi:hypothetical protein
MPVNTPLAKALAGTYGARGKRIYYKMESLAKAGKRPSFAKGLRTARRQGRVAASYASAVRRRG